MGRYDPERLIKLLDERTAQLERMIREVEGQRWRVDAVLRTDAALMREVRGALREASNTGKESA